MSRPNLKSVALPVPEIAIAVLAWGLRKYEAIGGRGWYRSKERL